VALARRVRHHAPLAGAGHALAWRCAARCPVAPSPHRSAAGGRCWHRRVVRGSGSAPDHRWVLSVDRGLSGWWPAWPARLRDDSRAAQCGPARNAGSPAGLALTVICGVQRVDQSRSSRRPRGPPGKGDRPGRSVARGCAHRRTRRARARGVRRCWRERTCPRRTPAGRTSGRTRRRSWPSPIDRGLHGRPHLPRRPIAQPFRPPTRPASHSEDNRTSGLKTLSYPHQRRNKRLLSLWISPPAG